MAHTAPWMEPPQMPDATSQPQHSEWPHSWPVPFNPHAFQVYQIANSDQSAQDLPGVVSQGVCAGSVPSSGAIVDHSEYAEACGIVEHAHPGADGELAVEDRLQECDAVPCPTRSEGRKGSRKRGRDWTDEETSVLVECKSACFQDKGSSYRKQKSSATNWEAIAEAVRDNRDTGASEKTGDRCRLRWDTLVKSHRTIKERCVESGKGFAEVMAEDTRSLKLATTLKPEWFEVIDTISGKPRSRKQTNPSVRDGCFNLSKNGGAEDGPVSGGMTRSEPGSHPVFVEGAPAVGTGSIPPAPVYTGISEPKHMAVPGFSSLGSQLRATLLDLILSGAHVDVPEILSPSRACEWLSIVQNRRRSEVYDDVSMLMKMGLMHASYDCEDGLKIEWSRFRVFDKFVKKLIGKNPVLDTHKYVEAFDRKVFVSRRESLTPHRIRVLTIVGCEQLESVDLRGLRKLRSLTISNCSALKEITGWKYLRELGWLEIWGCAAYDVYPDLRDLPSLRVCLLYRELASVDPVGHKFDISQCVRLRRLEIWADDLLNESGDLSSLKCLEELSFAGCSALSTVDGLSGLHSLTTLNLYDCIALRSLPDMGHMKELVNIDIGWTSVEEIPGVEKLVSLKTLYCSGSKLKHLPDLHHLPYLQYVMLHGTPLIEDDPLSFYFDKAQVSFNCEEKSVLVDVSDISDTGSSDDEDEYPE